MATDEVIVAGLLNWINCLDLNLNAPICSTVDLADGAVIWMLLQDVDPEFFGGNLPERIGNSVRNDNGWIEKWTNLKHVVDSLSSFLIEECDKGLPLFPPPDLKAIAQYGSPPDTITLLKLCVVAAAFCENRLNYLKKMQTLDPATMQVLMQVLQEAQENKTGSDEDEEDEDGDVNEQLEDDQSFDGYDETSQENVSANTLKPQDLNAQSPAAPSPVLPHNDKNPISKSDLDYEERISRIIAENARLIHEKSSLENQISNLNTTYNSLQEAHSKTLVDLESTTTRLQNLLSGHIPSLPASNTVTSQETLILDLESRLSETESQILDLRRQNESLRVKADRVQKLQDDHDELRINRDILLRKANAAEKYKSKLEAVQDLEKENSTLKARVEELMEELKVVDKGIVGKGDLSREVEEYRRLLPAIEQERHEVNEMKKRVEFDYYKLQVRFGESEEEGRRLRQEVEDLQGRLGLDVHVEQDNRRTSGVVDTQQDEGERDKDLETEEAEYEAAQARLEAKLMRDTSPSTAIPASASDGTTNDVPSPEHALASFSGETEDSSNTISESELRSLLAAMRAQSTASTGTQLKTQKKLVIMLDRLHSQTRDLQSHIRSQDQVITFLRTDPTNSRSGSSEAEKMGNKEEKLKDPKTEDELEVLVEEQETTIENLRREIRLMASAWCEQNQRFAALGAGVGGGGVALMRARKGHGEIPKSFLGKLRKGVDEVCLGKR